MNTAQWILMSMGGKAAMAVSLGAKREKFVQCTKRGPGRISKKTELARNLRRLSVLVPKEGGAFIWVPGIPDGVWPGARFTAREGRITHRSASGTVLSRTK